MGLALLPGMFTLDTRMSEALQARPELRQILPAFHPAFGRLGHPLLGKVLPRLVNVADAARVAGVDPQALLAVMNLPGAPAPHHAIPTSAERHSEPAPPWLPPTPDLLDVRAELERGEEPFATIMGALRTLPPGHVLTVLTPFEPAPLRRLLGDRGWQTHVGWDGATCRTSFWHPPATGLHPAGEAGSGRAAAGTVAPGSPSPGAPAGRLTRTAEGWTLDLRGLEPPQPLQLALASLDRGELPLTLLHHREPALLYPRLSERGLQWSVTTADELVTVRIHGG